MNFPRYIKEHIVHVIACFFLTVTTDIFLMTIGGSAPLMIYVALACSLSFFFCMYVDYKKLKNMFDDVQSRTDTLDKKYLVPEVMEKADSQEGEMLMSVLRKAEVSMSDNVAGYRRGSEEYRDYIETWVHEVKIPISASKMIIENHGDDAIAESGIADELDRIEGYVEQALFYARSSNVEKDFFIKETDLSEIVKGVISKRRKTLIPMHASIDMGDLQGGKEVLSDGKWLSFIISQIVDNSIKYASPDRNLKLSFYMSEENGKVVLDISDNGVGIKSSEISRAFDKGFTGSNGRIGRASTGIGLYLCKKLCVRLGHDIAMESEEGEGTTVKIMF
ncbi:MAG: sensor histidine kinase [Lachnospiraceae bacterium]|nr:sensor histidine kinase [Lachnospiraceae bacterium]